MGVMPKTNIYDPTPRGVDVATGEVGPERLRRVSVGWSRERYVQVGVGWVEQNSNLGTDGPPRTSTSSSPRIVDETDEKGREWLGQWCDMDRHSINELIRALRKARDEAFGRDE